MRRPVNRAGLAEAGRHLARITPLREGTAPSHRTRRPVRTEAILAAFREF
jgi:hypothetical protein